MLALNGIEVVMEDISWGAPKMHTIMIVNLLATAADIERFSKQYGAIGQPIRLPIWRTPDMPAGECSIRCAIQDDISNEYSGLYEDHNNE